MPTLIETIKRIKASPEAEVTITQEEMDQIARLWDGFKPPEQFMGWSKIVRVVPNV